MAYTLFASGCRDPRLLDADPNDGTVRTVTAYDVTLGPEASPEDVAFVLLRAIHDHVVAAQAGDREGVKAAKRIERSVAAPKRIHELLRDVIQQNALPVDLTPAQSVHYESKWWAPIVAHYTADLDMTREEARSRMRLVNRPPDSSGIHIDVENPVDHRKATLVVSLAREDGYWRVFKVGYSPISVARMERPRDGAASQPAGNTGS